MRPITSADAPAIAKLEMELFPDNCFNEKTLAREIEIGEGFVIYDGELLTAYLLARRSKDILDILRVGVRPDYQHNGLGVELMNAAVEGEKYIILSVRKDNKAAINLYRRFGFIITGYSGSSWIMYRSR